MEVAAAPDQRRRAENAILGQTVIEKMAGTAQEHKSIGAHRVILHLQSLGITPLVGIAYALDDLHDISLST